MGRGADDTSDAAARSDEAFDGLTVLPGVPLPRWVSGKVDGPAAEVPSLGDLPPEAAADSIDSLVATVEGFLERSASVPAEASLEPTTPHREIESDTSDGESDDDGPRLSQPADPVTALDPVEAGPTSVNEPETAEGEHVPALGTESQRVDDRDFALESQASDLQASDTPRRAQRVAARRRARRRRRLLVGLAVLTIAGGAGYGVVSGAVPIPGTASESVTPPVETSPFLTVSDGLPNQLDGLKRLTPMAANANAPGLAKALIAAGNSWGAAPAPRSAIYGSETAIGRWLLVGPASTSASTSPNDPTKAFSDFATSLQTAVVPAPPAPAGQPQCATATVLNAPSTLCLTSGGQPRAVVLVIGAVDASGVTAARDTVSAALGSTAR